MKVTVADLKKIILTEVKKAGVPKHLQEKFFRNLLSTLSSFFVPKSQTERKNLAKELIQQAIQAPSSVKSFKNFRDFLVKLIKLLDQNQINRLNYFFDQNFKTTWTNQSLEGLNIIPYKIFSKYTSLESGKKNAYNALLSFLKTDPTQPGASSLKQNLLQSELSENTLNIFLEDLLNKLFPKQEAEKVASAAKPTTRQELTGQILKKVGKAFVPEGKMLEALIVSEMKKIKNEKIKLILLENNF